MSLPTPLGHTNLGPMGLGGGVNLDLDGSQITSSNIADGESPSSLNWRHFRTNLIPRDELTPWVTMAPAPTGTINGLFTADFETRLRFIIAHDKAHVWACDGTTVTDLRNVSGCITSGSDTSPWSGAMVGGHGSTTINSVYAFCNGSNELCYWDGDVATDALTMISRAGYAGPAALIGKYVAGWAGRCFIANNVDGAAARSSRVRWNSDNDLNNWNSATGAGAGAVDLLDAPGEITGMLTVSESQLTVFKTTATVLAEETGNARNPIAFPTYLPIGSLMGHTAKHVATGAVIFPGIDSFYLLQGQNVTPINPKIWNMFSRILNYDRLAQAVSWVDPVLGFYFISIPVSGEVDSNGKARDATRTFVYNYKEDIWNMDYYTSEIHSAATSNLGPTLLWSGAVGTWGTGATGTLPWASYTSTGAPPLILVGTLSSVGVWGIYKFVTSITGTELGNNIPYSYSTKDYRINKQGQTTIYGLYVDFYSPSGLGQIQVQVVKDRYISGTPIAKNITIGNGRLFFPLRETSLFARFIITASAPVTIFNVEPVVTERDAAEH